MDELLIVSVPLGDQLVDCLDRPGRLGVSWHWMPIVAPWLCLQKLLDVVVHEVGIRRPRRDNEEGATLIALRKDSGRRHEFRGTWQRSDESAPSLRDGAGDLHDDCVGQ